MTHQITIGTYNRRKRCYDYTSIAQVEDKAAAIQAAKAVWQTARHFEIKKGFVVVCLLSSPGSPCDQGKVVNYFSTGMELAEDHGIIEKFGGRL